MWNRANSSHALSLRVIVLLFRVHYGTGPVLNWFSCFLKLIPEESAIDLNVSNNVLWYLVSFVYRNSQTQAQAGISICPGLYLLNVFFAIKPSKYCRLTIIQTIAQQRQNFCKVEKDLFENFTCFFSSL